MFLSKHRMNNLCFVLIMAYDFSGNSGWLKSTKLSYIVNLYQNSWPSMATVKISMSFISAPLTDASRRYSYGITDLACAFHAILSQVGSRIKRRLF